MDDSACSLTKCERETDASLLFENCAWLYAFCRERLFHDHTEEIAQALFPDGAPSNRMFILEVGCGPGFYARRLAQRYPGLRVLGIDRSSRLIARARKRALSGALANCEFQQGDVEELSACVEAVDAVISSRLMLVIANRRMAIAEVFRVLKPGGRLFLAEPTSHFKTQLPISAMRLANHFMRPACRMTFPQTAEILASGEFEDLIHSQPWDTVSIQMHGDYQCAVCEKRGAEVQDSRALDLPEHGMPDATSRSLV